MPKLNRPKTKWGTGRPTPPIRSSGKEQVVRNSHLPLARGWFLAPGKRRNHIHRRKKRKKATPHEPGASFRCRKIKGVVPNPPNSQKGKRACHGDCRRGLSLKVPTPRSPPWRKQVFRIFPPPQQTKKKKKKKTHSAAGENTAKTMTRRRALSLGQ